MSTTSTNAPKKVVLSSTKIAERYLAHARKHENDLRKATKRGLAEHDLWEIFIWVEIGARIMTGGRAVNSGS